MTEKPMDHLNSLAGAVAKNFQSRIIVKYCLIAGAVCLLLGAAGGWYVRSSLIETPDALVETERQYEDEIAGLNSLVSSYKNEAESHRARVDDLLSQLRESKPEPVKIPRDLITVEMLSKSRKDDWIRDRRTMQLRDHYNTTINGLMDRIDLYEEREGQYEEVIEEQNLAISNLQQSLDSAIERGDVAVERERRWSKVRWSDGISYGPAFIFPIYPDIQRPSVGLQVGIDLNTIWKVIGQ